MKASARLFIAVITAAAAMSAYGQAAALEAGNALRAPPSTPFPPRHACRTPLPTQREACDALRRIMNPDWSAPEDLILLPHRGYWGFGAVAFVPENSGQGLANVRSNRYAASEVDFMPSLDGLVLSHDYVLTRIADAPPDDRRLIYDTPTSELTRLHLRDRFGNVTEEEMATSRILFDAYALDEMPAVIFADIKQKEGPGQAFADNWVAALSRILETTPRTHLARLVVKTPYTPDYIRDTLSPAARPRMDEILWMPQVADDNYYKSVHPGVDGALVRSSADFVDVWRRTGLVAAFETNWKLRRDSRRSPFSRGGTDYANILDYIRRTTGLRGGVFAEEPVGPRGVVNRHAQWHVKDASADLRGDFFFEAVEPEWGGFMIVTTDRPDIWEEMRRKVWPTRESEPLAPGTAEDFWKESAR